MPIDECPKRSLATFGPPDSICEAWVWQIVKTDTGQGGLSKHPNPFMRQRPGLQLSVALNRIQAIFPLAVLLHPRSLDLLREQILQAERQERRGAQFGTARLPSPKIVGDRHTGAAGPTVESAQRLDAVGRAVVFGEDGQ